MSKEKIMELLIAVRHSSADIEKIAEEIWQENERLKKDCEFWKNQAKKLDKSLPWP